MEIFIAVVIVALIGIIIGFGLSFASSVFSVKKDETEEKVRECLPGANCGACGFSGCDGYAQAIAKGETDNIEAVRDITREYNRLKESLKDKYDMSDFPDYKE